MSNKLLIGTALLSRPIVGGLVYASAQKPAGEHVQKSEAEGFICPVTCEELPCPHCCP
jgi:hypothetical protein